MLMKKVGLVKWTSLVVGCVIQLLWGSLGTTPIYINAMKIQYNLSQSTVEMLPAVIAVGRCFTPFASFIFQMFGPVASFLFGMWMGAGGYFLLWSTVFFKTFYQTYPFLMAIYFFLVGHGNMHTYLAVLSVVTRNFKGTHQGKAVSLLEACYGATPLVWLAIYRIWFSGQLVYDDSEQDLTGFLLAHAVISAVCTLAAMFLVRPVEEDYQPIEEGPDSTNNKVTNVEEDVSQESEVKQSETERAQRQPSWREALVIVFKPFTKWQFQLLLWVFCITNTVCLGVEMNLSVYTKSVYLYHLVDASVILYNVCLCVFRLLIGVAMDTTKDKIPKMTFTAFLSLSTMVTFGFATAIPGTVATVISIAIVTGVYCGVTKAITAVLVASKMDERYFASYWGIFQSVQCFTLLIWQKVLSSLYEAMIPEGFGLECFGDDCMRWTFLIACILSFLAMVFSFLLAVINKF